MKTIQEQVMESKVWEKCGVVGFIIRATAIVWIPIMVIGCFFARIFIYLWTGTDPERFK